MQIEPQQVQRRKGGRGQRGGGRGGWPQVGRPGVPPMSYMGVGGERADVEL